MGGIAGDVGGKREAKRRGRPSRPSALQARLRGTTMSPRPHRNLWAGGGAALIALAIALAGWSALAEPLDKESCAKLQGERKQLLNRDMQTALEQGPDWVKSHLTEEAIAGVRRFLNVEEQIQFRCRGGGIEKPAVTTTGGGAAEAPPKASATIPLPDRKPTRPTNAASDAEPSQALANSDKTPPGKAKATP
jgi:hypothetical protein